MQNSELRTTPMKRLFIRHSAYHILDYSSSDSGSNWFDRRGLKGFGRLNRDFAGSVISADSSFRGSGRDAEATVDRGFGLRGASSSPASASWLAWTIPEFFRSESLAV